MLVALYMLVVGGFCLSVLLCAFAGGAICSCLFPLATLPIGAFFFVVGTWWQGAETLAGKMRNYAFIHACGILLVGGFFALYFREQSFQFLMTQLAATGFSVRSVITGTLGEALFLFGCGEAVYRVARRWRKEVRERGWRGAFFALWPL